MIKLKQETLVRDYSFRENMLERVSFQLNTHGRVYIRRYPSGLYWREDEMDEYQPVPEGVTDLQEAAQYIYTLYRMGQLLT